VHRATPGSPSRRWLPLLAIVATYFLAGRLGLLLAIPPGYATPAWLPSGVALVGVLLVGARALPAVVLASFLVNCWPAFAAAQPLTVARTLAVAAIIAVGAALQAASGASLVRRWVGPPGPLARTRDVFGFLVLGGPVSCVVNATIAVTTLVVLTGLPAGRVWFTWWTWWVGDTIGVLVGAPVALALAAPLPRELWRRRRRTVALPLVILFCFAVAGFMRVRALQQAPARPAVAAPATAAAAGASTRIAAALASEPWQVWTFFAMELVLTSLIGAILLITTGESAAVEALVEARTAELSAVNAALASEIAQRHRIAEQRASEQQAAHEQARMLQAVLDSVGDGIIVADRSGAFQQFNPAARALLAQGAVASSPDQWPALYGLYSVDGARQLGGQELPLARALRGEEVDGFEIVVKRPTGESGAIVSVTSRAIRDPQGNVQSAVAVLRDVTERRRAEQEQRESEERYRYLVDASAGLICTHDFDGVLMGINPAAAASLGYRGEDLVGRSIAELMHPATKHLFGAYLGRIIKQGEDSGVLRLVTAHGEELFWQYRNRLLQRGALGPYVLGIAVDATDQTRSAREAAYRAYHDALTGLPNRYLFGERLARMLEQAKRERRTFAVLFVDLDGLKKLNDGLGHAAGDWALCEIATRLQSRLRRTDTASRFAGDEFAVLIQGAGRVEFAERKAQELIDAVTAPAAFQGTSVELGASIGIAIYPLHGLDAEELIRCADEAMYEAKRQGGRRFEVARLPADMIDRSST
jgi:diguanylate cyclase (GGDEF)-like protein/PAS domain S-box-containing protein